MKAYKIELLVIDFDGLGEQGIVETIASRRWPNDCISPSVEACQEADIGVWSDDHPLNRKATASAEYARLFPATSPAPAVVQMTAQIEQAMREAQTGQGSYGPNYDGNKLAQKLSAILSASGVRHE